MQSIEEHLEKLRKKLKFFKVGENPVLESFRDRDSEGFLDYTHLILPDYFMIKLFPDNFKFSAKSGILDYDVLNMIYSKIFINPYIYKTIEQFSIHDGLLENAMFENIEMGNETSRISFMNDCLICNNNFKKVKFYNIVFSNSCFSGNKFEDCIFIDCNFENTVWTGKEITSDTFDKKKNIVINNLNHNNSYFTAKGYGATVFFEKEKNELLNNNMEYWEGVTINQKDIPLLEHKNEN